VSPTRRISFAFWRLFLIVPSVAPRCELEELERDAAHGPD
jgi:hypothetical protein